jgi:hypothetical protein
MYVAPLCDEFKESCRRAAKRVAAAEEYVEATAAAKAPVTLNDAIIHNQQVAVSSQLCEHPLDY